MPSLSFRPPILLGVNIDHVATLRQARGTVYPSPLHAALIAEQAGADAITLHLREDRRHIQDADVWMMRQSIQSRMNLELALTDEMLEHALKIKPQDVCLVPERREEVTTEGGLDVVRYFERVKLFTHTLSQAGCRVSLFIDASPEALHAAKEAGAPVVEIHTGAYADAQGIVAQAQELSRVQAAVDLGCQLGLHVNAGHGLHYHNVQAIAALDGICELNIGHAIVSHAVFVGFAQAVSEMKNLMRRAAGQA